MIFLKNFFRFYCVMEQIERKNIKIAVIGSHSTGKTSYINRLIDGSFDNVSTNIQTLIQGDDYLLNTDFTFYDIASQGNENENEIKNINFDGILLFIDLIDKNNSSKIEEEIKLYDEYITKYPNAYVLVCLNKCDVFYKTKNIVNKKYKYNILLLSVRSCYNFQEPLSYMNKLYNRKNALKELWTLKTTNTANIISYL